jgi:hypothetical protein
MSKKGFGGNARCDLGVVARWWCGRFSRLALPLVGGRCACCSSSGVLRRAPFRTHRPYVGPAIVAEAGRGYVFRSYGAIAAFAIFQLSGVWRAVRGRPLRSDGRRGRRAQKDIRAIYLRHPAFLGLRDDKRAREVARESRR